jgi:dynein heavy chain
LLKAIHASLQDLLKALKGLVVMSESLEKLASSVFNNIVPKQWASVAYPSLKPLAAWVADLLARMQFIQKWNQEGIPPLFWISGFFFPQAFLTGTLQNYARRNVISIDTLSFQFDVLATQPTSKPEEGCYIYGLFLEGARWGGKALAESRPKELFTEMPTMWLRPVRNRVAPQSGM